MSTKNRLKPCANIKSKKLFSPPPSTFHKVSLHSLRLSHNQNLHVLDIWVSLWFVIKFLIASVTKYSLIKICAENKKYFQPSPKLKIHFSSLAKFLTFTTFHRFLPFYAIDFCEMSNFSICHDSCSHKSNLNCYQICWKTTFSFIWF